MSKLGLDILDRTIHDTNTWLKEISGELGHLIVRWHITLSEGSYLRWIYSDIPKAR